MRDFVVVGAGPSGSRFARQAARRGHDVLVLEQGKIGEPLACSGHVSLDVWEYVPNGERTALHQNDIYGARFHTGGPGTDGHRFYKEEVVSNAIDRVGLDRTLAATAEEAGADIRDRHTMTEVDPQRDRVLITASGPDGTVTHEARLVAGCDGPRSRVRNQLGIPDPDAFLHGVLGFDDDPDHDDFVDVHLTIPGFFAWRIPRGDAGVEYGLAVRPGNDAPKRFQAFLDDYDVEVGRRCSGAIPIGPPPRTVGHRGFLIGDAAGQTKPFTGGGILYGMRAADHAAQTINPADPATLGDYERSWRSDLRTEIRLGHLVRAGYSLPRPLQELGLGLFSGEIAVHMDEPTTLFSREQVRALLR